VIVLVALSVGFGFTLVIAVPLVALTFFLAAQMGRRERSRAAALLGLRVAPPHAPTVPGHWRTSRVAPVPLLLRKHVEPRHQRGHRQPECRARSSVAEQSSTGPASGGYRR
jgi:hypothetical protein